MGAIRRTFLHPELETEITIREAPLEIDGQISRRLKAWVFENAAGEVICHIEAHRMENLGEFSEPELEQLYYHALDYGTS